MPVEKTNSDLLKYIRESLDSNTFCGPYGLRKVLYLDYVASGRDIIRNATNASEHDAVIFAGSGTTAAIHKLIFSLHLKEPPIIFAGPFEHHSNLLPWREIGAEIISIRETSNGLVDISHLESQLQLWAGKCKQMIGCFTAASNITGILTDVNAVTICLHKYGALAFWDYATAAPYVNIDMNPIIDSHDQCYVYKDAVYFSPHKFIGGISTPGVLIAKKSLFRNPTPEGCGGGTIFFVRREGHRYLQEPEMREEGGTPDIIGSIRAGLVIQLKQAIGTDLISEKDTEMCRIAYDCWKKCKNLVLLGHQTPPSLPIFSFLIYHPITGRFLHHNFVTAILNDVFGIQSRGGCACAGPYAEELLGISEAVAEEYEKVLIEDSRLDRVHLRRYREYSEREILRPGFTRFNLPFFINEECLNFILEALQLVAEYGWLLLPQYMFNKETGEWRHRDLQVYKDRKWLGNISYSSGCMQYKTNVNTCSKETLPQDYQSCLDKAKKLFKKAEKMKYPLPDQELLFSDGTQHLRCLDSHPQQDTTNDTLTASQPTINDTSHPKSNPLEDISCSKSQSNILVQITKLSTNDDKSDGKEVSIVSSNLVPAVCPFKPKPKKSELKKTKNGSFWFSPPKEIFTPAVKAITNYKMIKDGDHVLLCLSGGKDSLSMLHIIHQYKFYAQSKGIHFEIGAVTVDPQTPAYDPSPLKKYLATLNIPYFFESQGILETAANLPYKCESICSFCSRMKRGRIYACARREKYNVIALGQHLDDLAESFLMSFFHNGILRTMKAHYTVKEGDLHVIRPLVHVREKDLRMFASKCQLPVINENCPACFEAPKERHRMKQLLATQELLFPKIYNSMSSAMAPIMGINKAEVSVHELLANIGIHHEDE
ncbi:unnamed protein product [Acanthosepion pharaonis]|uniref:Uncharacterized protein n=1 Tax=Acanthosepion pharaonis TaxID=158019 RepID=A0A812CJM7_ACAPH|nr:unnamed protein product [Sepia pharaonis]